MQREKGFNHDMTEGLEKMKELESETETQYLCCGDIISFGQLGMSDSPDIVYNTIHFPLPTVFSTIYRLNTLDCHFNPFPQVPVAQSVTTRAVNQGL